MAVSRCEIEVGNRMLLRFQSQGPDNNLAALMIKASNWLERKGRTMRR